MTEAVALLLDDISDNALAECLRARGWHCERANDFQWETPKQFDERHGKTPHWLSKQIYRQCPVPAFEGYYGKGEGVRKRRLIRLRSNLALEDWCNQAK